MQLALNLWIWGFFKVVTFEDFVYMDAREDLEVQSI